MPVLCTSIPPFPPSAWWCLCRWDYVSHPKKLLRFGEEMKARPYKAGLMIFPSEWIHKIMGNSRLAFSRWNSTAQHSPSMAFNVSPRIFYVVGLEQTVLNCADGGVQWHHRRDCHFGLWGIATDRGWISSHNRVEKIFSSAFKTIRKFACRPRADRKAHWPVPFNHSPRPKKKKKNAWHFNRTVTISTAR